MILQTLRASGTQGGLREEAAEVAGGLLGSLLGEEVSGLDRPAAHLLGPRPPDRERVVPGGDRAGLAPQGKGRAGDPPPATVGLVVLVVQGRGGAVLLADGMDGGGVAELGDVLGADLRREGAWDL